MPCLVATVVKDAADTMLFVLQDAATKFSADMSRRHLATAFDCWRQEADDRSARRRSMLRAVERLAALRNGMAFQAWHEAVLDRRRLRALLIKGVK
jgi:hypothetical protein